MSLLSPRGSSILSTAQSENSHSSESAASHPSSGSSNTSCSTHFQVNAPSAVVPLPRCASPPQPPQLRSDPVTVRTQSDVKCKHSSSNSTLFEQHIPGLWEPLPPASYSERKQSRTGRRRRVPFMTSIRGPSSRSPSRERVNLNDEGIAIGANGGPHQSPNRYLFLSAPPPPSAYGSVQRSRSATKTRSCSPTRITSGGVNTSELDSRSYETLDPKLSHFGGNTKLCERHNRQDLLTTVTPMHFNKPLPRRPGSVPFQKDFASASKPSLSHPFRPPPIPLRHSTYFASSAEESETQFGHYNHSTDFHYANSHPQGASSLHTGIGSNLLPTILGDSKSWRQFLEPHHHQQIGNQIPLYAPLSAPSPSGGYSSTSIPSSIPFFTRSATSHRSTFTTAHTAPSRPVSYSYGVWSLGEHESAPSTSELSLGKRLKRAFSFSISRTKKDIGNGAQDSYLYSEGAHSSTLFRNSIMSPKFVSGPEKSAEPSQGARVSPRRLKKKRPSSLSTAPMSTPTPGSPKHNSVVEPSQDHTPTPGLSPMKRTRSSPARHGRVRTPPPVPPLPAAFETIPAVSSPESQTQFTSASRKLKKKGVLPRRPDSASYKFDTPVRLESPSESDTNGSSFSQASRSHSTPNLWPRATNHSAFPYLNTHHGLESTPSPQPPHIVSDSPCSSLHFEKLPRPVSLKVMSPMTAHPSPLQPKSNQRWTLAASEIPDEQLATELERLRSVGWGLGFQGELVRFKGNGKAFGQKGKEEQNTSWEKAENETWLVARQALMICREILRTEKSYRRAMVRLQRGETDKAPPPLLLQYLPALVSASQDFNARLDDDPSTWGVSAAFIGMEDILDAALVAWSGIVGDFFSASKGSPRRRWSAGPGDKDKKYKEKTAVTGAPVLPPIGSSAYDYEYDRVQDAYVAPKSSSSIWRMSMPALSQLLTTPTEAHHIESQKYLQSTSRASSGSVKTPTVQDLAIQPTQRVMRYVLLYKDLLNCTPITSPARPLVERALESATRIAQRCNRAQDNAAFLT